MTGLADNLYHLAVHKAGHSVVQEQATAGAIVVNRIAESWEGLNHERFL
jgi:hypothetical protein